MSEVKAIGIDPVSYRAPANLKQLKTQLSEIREWKEDVWSKGCPEDISLLLNEMLAAIEMLLNREVHRAYGVNL